MMKCIYHYNNYFYIQKGPVDLPEVYAALLTIQAKWDRFTLQLGLFNDPTISAIKRQHNDPASCLLDALTNWLNCNYDVERRGYPSWRRVCIATASPAGGGNRKLAEDIADNHPQQMMSPINKGFQ